MSRDELHILSRNAQRLAPSVVVAIEDWIEINRKKQVAGFTFLRFTSLLLLDGREYNQQAFQRANWSRQAYALIRAVQERTRNPVLRILTFCNSAGIECHPDKMEVAGSNPARTTNKVRPVILLIAKGKRVCYS